MKNKLSFYILALGAMLAGCYPDNVDYYEELDVAISHYKDDYDFQAQSTYAMPDQIVKITGNKLEGDDVEFVPDVVANALLGMIEDNMSSLGWQRVDIDEDPDMLLAPAAWETTTVSWWYDYWGWWWGGYYPPGWGGCCWGGWYPPVYVSSYSTGTLVMTLIDPDVQSASGRPISQWTGAISGLMSGAYNADRARRAIDQTFAQSPYLKTN